MDLVTPGIGLIFWTTLFFLILLLLVNMLLADQPLYMAILLIQVIFYLLAVVSLLGFLHLQNKTIGRIPLFFTMVNVAILIAWIKYAAGVRRELWSPTQR